MEHSIAVTFDGGEEGKFDSKSYSTMKLHGETYSMNHIYGTIILLRDRIVSDPRMRDDELRASRNEMLIEDLEDLIALFRKYPTQSAFPEWLKSLQ